jgi:hypothetical protein
MIPQDVRAILTNLLARSRKKEVEWLESRATTFSHFGDYGVIFPTSSLMIWEEPSEGTYGGRILNSRGDVIVSFDSEGSGEDRLLLEELIDLARRKVLRADETLAEIQKALESSPRVGSAPPSRSGADDDEEVPF